MGRKVATISTLQSLIIFVIVLILIILPFFGKVYDRLFGISQSSSLNSLDALTTRLDNIYDREDIAVDIGKDFIIAGFTQASFQGCKPDKGCLCLCRESCNIRNIEKCSTIRYEFSNDFVIEPTDNLQQCTFIKQDGSVQHKGCIEKDEQ
jgi:hypothetical protein